jgi:hypothetical protein
MSSSQPASSFSPLQSRSTTLILDQVANDRRLVEHPLPPLGEAFAAAGLDVHRGFVGLPGTDWVSVDELMSFGGDDLDDTDEDDAFSDSGSSGGSVVAGQTGAGSTRNSLPA